jgi:hypothetical protein
MILFCVSVAALVERSNRNTDIMGSTMLPQASERLHAELRNYVKLRQYAKL